MCDSVMTSPSPNPPNPACLKRLWVWIKGRVSMHTFVCVYKMLNLRPLDYFYAQNSLPTSCFFPYSWNLHCRQESSWGGNFCISEEGRLKVKQLTSTILSSCLSFQLPMPFTYTPPPHDYYVRLAWKFSSSHTIAFGCMTTIRRLWLWLPAGLEKKCPNSWMCGNR